MKILCKCILFAGMEEQEISGMLGCLGARQKRYAPGEVILQEGDAVRSIGILLSGAARIEQVDYDGNRRILSALMAGELFAESFACADGVSRVDVIAAGETEAMWLEAQRLLQPCSQACAFHGKLIHNLARLLAQKNLAFFTKNDILSRRTTEDKLMAYLHSEARRQGCDEFDIPFDRQALSDYLGVDRSGLSTVIGKLKRQGVLTSKRNHFTLKTK